MSPSQSYSRKLSRLHAKGIFTLSLFILAESITFVNASSSGPTWSSSQQNQHHQQQRPHEQQQQTYAHRNNGNQDEAANTECVNPEMGGGAPRFINRLSLFARNRPCAPTQWNKKKTMPATSLDKTMSTKSRAVHLDERCCRDDCSSCLKQVISAASVATLCRGGHLHTSAADAAAAAIVSTPYNIPLNVWKILFQVFLTALNVACWLIPLKSKRISQNKLALSLANAFSGGVFLSLAFGHLIPECLHGFVDGHYNEAAPFLLVLAGYLLIFFVEKVAFDAHDILHEMVGEQHNINHHQHPNPTTNHAHLPAATDKPPAINGSSTTPPSTSSTGRSAVILLGALAVHSVLEMMALGLANTFGDCALLTLSISLHQPAESIALLVAFLKSGLSEQQIITFLSIFSCMGPIGVGLGMLVNEYAAPIVDSIMLAVVAGTFIYVGATEVIPEEWEDSSHKWKKFIALMSGIVSILCITQYTMALGH